jgi:hypothetical protein
MGTGTRRLTAMNTSFNQGSARIYQFPVGGRSGLQSSFGEHRHDEIKTVADLAPSRVATVGGAWYHEAAIQESKPVRER